MGAFMMIILDKTA
jgi:cell division cycle 14